VEKYFTAEQVTDDNMTFGSTDDNKSFGLLGGYLSLQIHTLSLCSTHCFSSANMVARTSLNV